LLLDKDNGKRAAWHVPSKNVKLDILNEFWEWDNKYYHKKS